MQWHFAVANDGGNGRVGSYKRADARASMNKAGVGGGGWGIRTAAWWLHQGNGGAHGKVAWFERIK